MQTTRLDATLGHAVVPFCRQHGNVTVSTVVTGQQVRHALELASDMLDDGVSDDAVDVRIPRTMVLASLSGHPVGIALVHLGGPVAGRIAWVYVRPRARRLGIGQALLEAARHLHTRSRPNTGDAQ
jgi:GNAT superfamily N-acetyltransferase